MALLCHSYICLIGHTWHRFCAHVVLMHTSRHFGLRKLCIPFWLTPGRIFVWQNVASDSCLLEVGFCRQAEGLLF